jgi:ATP-dependent Clp protease, protease subunit
MFEFMLSGYVGENDFSPDELSEKLKEANGQDIVCTIVSGGGSVFAEKAMNAMIAGYSGKKTAKILGVCASAATKFMLAFDSIEMDEQAYLMIHNPSGFAGGDAEEMRKMADLTEKIEMEYAEAYSKKTGLSVAKCKELMKGETWLSANEALNYGFVDSVIRSAQNSKVAACIGSLDFGKYRNVPAKLNAMIEPKNPKKENQMFDKIQAMFPDLQPDAIVAKVKDLSAVSASVEDLKAQLSASVETSKAVQAKLEAVTAEKAQMEAKLQAVTVKEEIEAVKKEAGVELSNELEAKISSRISAMIKESDASRKAELREDAVLYAKAKGVPVGAGTFAPEPRKAGSGADSPTASVDDAYARLKAQFPTKSQTELMAMAVQEVKKSEGAK